MTSTPPALVRAERALSRLHARVRANGLLYRFTLFTRILLAIGFIPTGLVKIRGERFTMLPIEHPVGFFFEAMYQTGLYWNFLGWGQFVAAVLLLVPRTATLGAILLLPIILNVFVITISIDFAGTPVITGLMLLAVIYLLCWDYDRLKVIVGAVLSRPQATHRVPTSRLALWSERGAFTAFAAGGLAFFGATRSFLPMNIARQITLALFVAAAVLALVACVSAWHARRTGRGIPARGTPGGTRAPVGSV